MKKNLYPAFSEKEKQEIMAKFKRWSVYYYYKNEQGVFVKQPSIYYRLNQEFKTFDERYKHFHILRNIVENLLKKGFSPYQNNEEENTKYSVFSALDYVLELKKNIVKPTTFSDYKGRIESFKKYLKAKGLHKLDILELTKKDINDYLNYILTKSSPRNRNNTLAVLSAVFSTLEENELIPHNITSNIKKLQAKPKRNKTYTQTQENQLFEYLETHDKALLLFVKFVSYNFLRPIEVCRLQVKDIDFQGGQLFIQAKNQLVKIKIIPEILLNELSFLKNAPPTHYIFAPKGVGEWHTSETNKRDYWSKRFKDVKDVFGLGEEYGLYSFRHTFITKLYRELRKKYTPFETKSHLMLITGHTTMDALEKYLRDIDAELPEDYSHLLQ